MTDRLEHDLDAWWDADVLGDLHPPSTMALDDEIDAIRNLQASSPTAAPTPAFTTSLRVDLMMSATKMQAPARPARFGLRTKSAPSPIMPHPIPSRSRRRRFAWLEIAAAALIIFGLIGAAYGGGVFDRFSNQNPPPIPAVLGSNTTSTPATATANYRGDASRTGVMPGPAPAGAPTLSWKQDAGGTNPSSLAIDNGKVFTIVQSEDNGTYPYALKAFDFKTGAPLWSTGLDAANGSSPAAADGLVYADTTAGIVAFNGTDGSQVWSYAVGGYDNGATHGTYQPNGPAPAIAGGVLYFSVTDATIRAIDSKSGAEKWKVTIPGVKANAYTTEGPISTSPLAVANKIVYGAREGGRIFAVAAATGATIWTYKTDGSTTQPPVVDGNRVYLASVNTSDGRAGKSPGRLYGLDANTGKELWTPVEINASFTMAAADQLVFVSSVLPGGAPLMAFSGVTGRQDWSYPDAGGGFAPIFVFGQLYVPGADGSVDAMNALTGELSWSVFLNRVSEPVIVDGFLFAAGYDTIYAVGGNGAANAADTPVDLSGYAPCTPFGAVPTATLTGKPKHTIDAESELKTRSGAPVDENGRTIYFTEWPQLLATNAPTGLAASEAQTAGILTTFQAMGDCSVRSDGQRLIQGFFTGDFFWRGVAIPTANGYDLTWQYQPEPQELAAMTTAVLSDGRVAAVFQSTGPRLFVIFTEQNGHWLIDEFYKLVDQYNWSQQG